MAPLDGPRVLATNAGTPRSVGPRVRDSAIRKEPVPAIEVRDPGPKRGGLGSGVVGDAIGSPKHHGGHLQAVYAVDRAELDHWGGVLGRDLPDGWFGENLTIAGYEVDAAVLGETWRVGEVMLQVSAPRIPCRTFAAHMGVRGWVRRFTERGRTGAYLSVRMPGTIRPGDPLEVLERPDHGFTVPQVFRAHMGDRVLAAEILDAGFLPAEEHEWLAARR